MSDTANEQGLPDGACERGPEPALRPGAQLTRRRQERGISIDDAAKQLNLAPRQIQAIEEENYDALPGMASVRGFIRSYAKLLKIDAAPLLEMVAKETVDLQEPVMLKQGGRSSFADNRLPRMGRPGFPLKALLAFGLPVLLLAGGFALHQMGMLPALPAALDVKMRELSFASVPAPEEASPKTVNPAPTGDSLLLPNVKTEAITASIAVLEQPKTPSESAAVDGQQPTAASASITATAPAAAKANLLVLKLNQDSWVEALRANHTLLVSRVVKAGTIETIEIKEPVNLTIGNASGVEATWRGNRLDLQQGTKNNVFRTNLK